MHPLDFNHTYKLRRQRLRSAEQRILNNSRSGAAQRGLEHTITLKDIVIPKYCPVFGVELKGEGNGNDSPTIDRVDSNLGYVPGNVRVISGRANRIKSDASIEELCAIISYMEEHFEDE